MATCGPAALSFAVGTARDAANIAPMHAATPDYTRVDSLLNPWSPPAGPPAEELSPVLASPISSTPAAAPVALGNPDIEATLERLTQPTRDELHISLVSSVSSPPSTGDAPSVQAATADNADENAAVRLKTEDSGPTNSTSDVEMDDSSDIDMDLDEDPTTDTASVPVFRCMNDEYEECHTGQVTEMKLSRKVISDHFGRNKACTRLITDWPLFCRKHYQRATYNQKLWQARKMTLILRQFDIIEAQFPGVKYTVVLKSSEDRRLNEYSRAIADGTKPDEAASLVTTSEEKRKFEAPVKVLHELSKQGCLGVNKTKLEVENTVHLISTQFENGEVAQVPSIEFLPQLYHDGQPYYFEGRVKMPKRSKARISTKGSSQKTKSRVSEKGGIQKTSVSTPARKPTKATGNATNKLTKKA